MVLSGLITTTSPSRSFQQSCAMVALWSCIRCPKPLAFRDVFMWVQILKSTVGLIEISKCHQCPLKSIVGSGTRCPALHRVQPWTLPEVAKKKMHLSHKSNRLHVRTLCSELPHMFVLFNTLFLRERQERHRKYVFRTFFM